MRKPSISHMGVSKLSTLQEVRDASPIFTAEETEYERIIICQSHIVNGWDSNSGVIE